MNAARESLGDSVRQSLLTVAMLVLVCLLWMLRDLVMLIGFAALLAYALDPIVSWVARLTLPGGRSIPRGLAAGLVILSLAVVAGAMLATAVPRLVQQFVGFAGAAPAALARLEQQVQEFLEAHGLAGLLGTGERGTNDAASSMSHVLQGWVAPMIGSVVDNAGNLVGLILLPLFAFYILLQRGAARSGALRRVPADLVPQTVRFLDAVDRALRAYVRGQALVCLAMGATVALVLRLLGFHLALLLGVTVGLAEIVPILGFWIAASAIVLEGYSKSPGLAIAGLAAYIVVNNVMGTFVSPRLLGSQVKLHPFIVNVAVLGGGILLGPAGAILSLPVAAAVKAVLDEFSPPATDPSPRPAG